MTATESLDGRTTFLSTPSARRATGEEETIELSREFLSTPSARRATSRRSCAARGRTYFYPRPPRGGRRLAAKRRSNQIFYFYPRPPRGGRLSRFRIPFPGAGFLSTPSARRATSPAPSTRPRRDISIHALREEGDFRNAKTRPEFHNFYPRPPRGGRPTSTDIHPAFRVFLSTPSARRATTRSKTPCLFCGISIHALREEGDFFYIMKTVKQHNFYPRPPRGGRQQKQRQNLYFQTNCTTFCTNLEEP